jgi:hypothetical protein
VKLTGSKSVNNNPSNRFIKETLHKAHSFETLLTRIKARTPQHGTKSLLDTAKAVSSNIRTSLKIELKANKHLSDEQIFELCTRRNLLLDSIHQTVFDVIQPTEYTLYPIGIIAAAEILIKDFVQNFALILNPYSGNTYKINAHPHLLDFYRDLLSPYIKRKSKEENKLPDWIVILSYPAVQSTNILLHTIMVGHEVIHLKDYVSQISSPLITTGQVKIVKKNVRSEAKRLNDMEPAKLFQDTQPVLSSWLSEIIADLIAIRTFGPAYLFSFLSLSIALGVMDKYSDLHPSSRTRIILMLDELRNLGYMRPRKTTQRITEELKYWTNYTNSQTIRPNGAHYVALNSIMRARKRIKTKVRSATTGLEYGIDDFQKEVPNLLKYLKNGVPPSEIVDISFRSSKPATLAGILNAGVYLHLEGMKEIRELLAVEKEPDMEAMTKFNELLSRSIEISIALKEWQKSPS